MLGIHIHMLDNGPFDDIYDFQDGIIPPDQIFLHTFTQVDESLLQYMSSTLTRLARDNGTSPVGGLIHLYMHLKASQEHNDAL